MTWSNRCSFSRTWSQASSKKRTITSEETIWEAGEKERLLSVIRAASGIWSRTDLSWSRRWVEKILSAGSESVHCLKCLLILKSSASSITFARQMKPMKCRQSWICMTAPKSRCERNRYSMSSYASLSATQKIQCVSPQTVTWSTMQWSW